MDSSVGIFSSVRTFASCLSLYMKKAFGKARGLALFLPCADLVRRIGTSALCARSARRFSGFPNAASLAFRIALSAAFSISSNDHDLSIAGFSSERSQRLQRKLELKWATDR